MFVPELVEVELYRRLAQRTIGRRIREVRAPDRWFCRNGTTPEQLELALTDRVIIGVKRIGKLLLFEIADSEHATAAEWVGLDQGLRLGLRFGMTGRLLVDGEAAIDQLLYSSDRNDPVWDRFALDFSDGSTLAMRDPRRLGGVELDPDVSLLGPDAAAITLNQLTHALGKTSSPLKAALLDQSKVAGIGNLIVDETLWRVGLRPDRISNTMCADEVAKLHKAIRSTVALLQKRGGSHLGDLMDERRINGVCPTDGALLRRETVGGRTTYWCPRHQT